MEARLSSTTSQDGWRISQTQPHLLPILAFVTTGLLFCLTVVFVCRRIAGAIRQPLDATSLVFTAIIIAVCSRVMRQAWNHLSRHTDSSRVRFAASTVLSVIAIGVALSVSLPESPRLALVMLWAIVIGEQSWSWFVLFREKAVQEPIPRAAVDRRNSRSDSTPARNEPSNDTRSIEQSVDRALPPCTVSQQFTRSNAEDGSEILFGLLRGDFVTRERQRNLHVAFCPPFEAAPTMSVEQIDGPSATVKVSQIESYGARFNVRLDSASDQPTHVTLEFFARASLEQDASG